MRSWSRAKRYSEPVELSGNVEATDAHETSVQWADAAWVPAFMARLFVGASGVRWPHDTGHL